MFRKLLPVFAVLAAFFCTTESVSAQEMAGTYTSTKMDGSPIAQGYTIEIQVTHFFTAWNGVEHYFTQATIIDNATGAIVRVGEPGSLVWDPLLGFGQLTGTGGIQGVMYGNGPGSFVADYTEAGGNARRWNR